MRIIITEQQSEYILNHASKIIRNVLSQKDIEIDYIKIEPSLYPKRGLKVKLKLKDNTQKKEALSLIKGILGALGSFGSDNTYLFSGK